LKRAAAGVTFESRKVEVAAVERSAAATKEQLETVSEKLRVAAEELVLVRSQLAIREESEAGSKALFTKVVTLSGTRDGHGP
jgi:hypothetical protein